MSDDSSKDGAEAEHVMRCAACGKTGEGLKKCTACQSVLCCNVDCQRVHCNAHEKESKQKEAELHSAASVAHTEFTDDELFADPPEREICPICSIPLPFDAREATYHSCCSRNVCNGCRVECSRVLEQTNASRSLSNSTRDADSQLPMLEECCPFCRATYPGGAKELQEKMELDLERMRKRMEANDARAFYQMAGKYRFGIDGIPVDFAKAFQHMSRAADLGLAEACNNLGCYYGNGIGVERDEDNETYYLKAAAIKGDFAARFNLGYNAAAKGDNVLATKHWLISASAGHEKSMANISDAFRRRISRNDVLTKEIYEKTLRAYQQANDEVKSDARNAARRLWLNRRG